VLWGSGRRRGRRSGRRRGRGSPPRSPTRPSGPWSGASATAARCAPGGGGGEDRHRQRTDFAAGWGTRHSVAGRKESLNTGHKFLLQTPLHGHCSLKSRSIIPGCLACHRAMPTPFLAPTRLVPHPPPPPMTLSCTLPPPGVQKYVSYLSMFSLSPQRGLSTCDHAFLCSAANVRGPCSLPHGPSAVPNLCPTYNHASIPYIHDHTSITGARGPRRTRRGLRAARWTPWTSSATSSRASTSPRHAAVPSLEEAPL